MPNYFTGLVGDPAQKGKSQITSRHLFLFSSKQGLMASLIVKSAVQLIFEKPLKTLR